MQELKSAIADAANKLFGVDIEPELTRPEEKFGDYSTNIALQLAKKAAASPSQIARQLADELKNIPGVGEVSVAGPGFINFKLTDDTLGKAASAANNLPRPNSGKEVLVEFGDPNPFKEMHIGHLYSYIVGDSISRLLEASGATVRRLSYHGDVGLHVAKAIWGMQHQPEGKTLGEYYSAGARAYEEGNAKSEIDEINKQIYEKNNPTINKLHEQGVKQSFSNFDEVLELLKIKNDRRYLESETIEPGLKAVKDNLGKVFIESQGAVVFEGEKAGLHTRVFITSQGLPTYETKDLGLTQLKNKDYPEAARSIIITANEQSEYFKVMLAALTQINAELAKKTTHLSHGFLSLTSGKMSSRSGDVYPAMKLLLDVKDAVHAQYPDSEVKKEVTIGSVKYALLKHRLGSDIVFDVKESISLEGSSGPYLQYAHARACSILAKAGASHDEVERATFDQTERSLARKISEYPEVIEKAVAELMPHHIATYLYELAQSFNSFYEKSRIIGDERQNLRLNLVNAYKKVLASGLGLLNITAPEKM